jgi:mannose-6-phosphate isomerase-like protein (cupin superfamily)
MKFRLFGLLLALPLMSAEPAGYKYWNAQRLLDSEKALAPKMSSLKVASERVGTFGNHYALALHREASGQAELHQRQADLMVIQSGTATLVVGGTMVKPHATGAGEIRGPSIEGGTRQKISAGDIIHIPAKTPHQLLLDSGQQLNYFTLKVNE